MISAPPSPALKTSQASNTHTHNLRSAGPHTSGLQRPEWSPLCQLAPLKPAKHSQSLLHQPAPLRPAQACTISALPGHAPKACQAGDPHKHNLHRAVPSGCQAGDPQTYTISTRPRPSDLHRPAWSLPGPCPKSLPSSQSTDIHDLYSIRPMLQRPSSLLQQKASACRPMGPQPPTTCPRKAPNLPKRHTQTGLDAKGVTSEQLKLKFYYSRTGDFFFPLP
jgi:hypothetical protein